jgi:hypothetical protein
VSLSLVLGLASGGLIFIVYWLYYLQVRRGQSIPNAATWWILVVASTINTLSYWLIVKDVGRAAMATAMCLSAWLVFLYILRHRYFAKMGPCEWIMLGLSALVLGYWALTRDARCTNLAVQIVLTLAFWPVINGLHKRKLKEKPLSWWLAVTSYLLLLASLAAHWEGDLAILAFPLLGLSGNLIVAVMAKGSADRYVPEL